MSHRNRSKPRAILSSPVTLVLALALFVFLARSAWKIHNKSAGVSDKLDDAQAMLAKLEANKVLVQSKIDDLSTEAGIEASIRERYHAIRPGESVAVIIEDAPVRSVASTSADEPDWLDRLVRWFKS